MGPQISHSFEVDVPRRLSPALAILAYSGLRGGFHLLFVCLWRIFLEEGRDLRNPTRLLSRPN